MRLWPALALLLGLLAGPASAQTGTASGMSVTATGGGTQLLSALAAKNINTYAAAAFAPAGYVLGTLTSSVPTTLAQFYGSLGAAQAAYPIATSLTNYVDRIVVQTSINAVTTAGCGIDQLPLTKIYIDATVTWNGGCVSLRGVRAVYGGTTTFLTQSVGTSPALSYTGDTYGYLNSNIPLMDVDMDAYNTGTQIWTLTTGGVAIPASATALSTGSYVSGSSALQIASASDGIGALRVRFYNYDTPQVYATGSVYDLEFYSCDFLYNNKGITVPAALTNSFEKHTYIGGSASGNNYNVYIYDVDGSGNPGSGDFFLDHVSIDYPVIQEIYYDGLGENGGNDCFNPLFVTGSHLETGGTTSGLTVPRIHNNGCLFLQSDTFYESGSNPIGIVDPGYFSRTSFSNVEIPGVNQIPAVYTAGSPTMIVQANGLQQRYGSEDIILLQSSSGIVMSGPTNPVPQVQATSYSLGLNNQLHLQLLNTGGTITVPPDATTNQAIGTTIFFETTDSSTWTFSGAGPPTITSVGTGLTFGGKAGKFVGLTKTGTNAWLASGGMT